MKPSQIIQLNQIEERLDRAVSALVRIADALEGVLEATDPIRPLLSLDQLGEERTKHRVFYSDERTDIIKEQLAQRGKEYKERK